MHVKRIVVLPVFVGALGAVALGQRHPDFSGEWVLVAQSNRQLRASPTLSVRQNASTLVTGHGSGLHSSTYMLDGKEHTVTNQGVTSVTKAQWMGEKLVIERVDSYPHGLRRQTKQVWSLAEGKLTMEFTDLSNPQEVKIHSNTYAKKK